MLFWDPQKYALWECPVSGLLLFTGSMISILKEPLKMLALSQNCGSMLQHSAWQLLDGMSQEGVFSLQQLLQWDLKGDTSGGFALASAVKMLKAILPLPELQDLLQSNITQRVKVITLRHFSDSLLLRQLGWAKSRLQLDLDFVKSDA